MAERLILRRHPDAARLVRERSRLVSALRLRLESWGLVEAHVPPWQPAAGPEPHLSAPRVELPGLPGALWLQTSPELLLKRLACAGLSRVFALGPAFRGGRAELSAAHQPAFSMLEWYRPGEQLAALEQDLLALVAAAAGALGVEPPPPGPSLSVAEALQEFGGVDAEPLLDGNAAAFARAARSAGLSGCRHTDDLTTLLGRVLVERVEPGLTALPGVVFLHGWPAAGAALAALDKDDPRLALRVEAYLSGVELANGYVELLDADALEQRWDELAAQCDEGEAGPRDEGLLHDLRQHPPPPLVGMALGVDRLHMALLGAPDLSHVLPLSLHLADGADTST